MGLIGAGSAATLLTVPSLNAAGIAAEEWEKWRRELLAPEAGRQYFSDKHTDARMHLGGIGTGNFEIGADGQLTTWQLFNTLRDGHVPFYFLAKIGGTTKLLQTAGGPDWPRIKRITMTGDYPVAQLRFEDAELPVKLELTAFSPFAPLDTRFSSMPLAAFIFQIQNTSKEKQRVSLAALMQNPVGYDANGENQTLTNANFGQNINSVLREGQATGLFMHAAHGNEPTLDKPLTICTLPNLKPLNAPPLDRPANLKLQILKEPQFGSENLSDASQTIIWLEEPPARVPEPFLRAARDAVKAGATLVFSGKTIPLLENYAIWTGGKPVGEASSRADILFEDFEHGYENWTVEGEAFGKAPPHGTLPGQQKVSGFLGQGLVNSFLRGDETTGRLISKPFVVERHFIRFLVGGGHHDQTQIRLIADGKVARATSGKDNERLEPTVWEVADLEGRTGHIEIVDEQKGGWGHINVDQIEFSDLPGERALMLLLEELLPARFSGVRAAASGNTERKAIRLENPVLQPGAEQSTLASGASLLIRRLGKGQVAIVTGSLLEPGHAMVTNRRQEAYTFLCGLAGAEYKPLSGPHPKAPGFGTLALTALSGNSTVLPAFEDPQEAWKRFAAEGRFISPNYEPPDEPTSIGRTVYGAVASMVELAPGGSAEVPFLLAWHYPNKYATHEDVNGGTWMGCHYATQWADARVVIKEAGLNFEKLHARTELFRKTFYDSTLPAWLLDCLTANAAIIRHIGVLFRIANGDVYGWEGSNGCCDPTCTHVWGYEQSLSRLFPGLEREMRRIDFKHQQRADGGVNNRTEVPSPAHPTGEQPFTDGHASCILKAYREGLNCSDESFFQGYWPDVKKAVEYLTARDAKTAGGKPAGILQDEQWNTYDEALHGVTTFMSGYYLAALLAAEAWALRVHDKETAVQLREIFEAGQKKLVELCWNGEYFQQHLPDYLQRQGEVGPGCMADQLIGQWWAHQLGLGYILPREMVVAGLSAIFKHNFKSDLTNWKHSPRAFAGAKDKGLIICTWPKGGRPAGVMLYSDEVWTGIEYQVAAHMIYEGLIEEGLTIVKGARERYDGVARPPIQRNPWNEIECGGHYARAMSSWSLLLALSGWEYDGPRQTLQFTPRHTPEEFKSFFTGPEGWGSARQSRQEQVQVNEIKVSEGRLELRKIGIGCVGSPKRVKVTCAGKSVRATHAFEAGLVSISLAKPFAVKAGQSLSIRIS